MQKTVENVMELFLAGGREITEDLAKDVVRAVDVTWSAIGADVEAMTDEPPSVEVMAEMTLDCGRIGDYGGPQGATVDAALRGLDYAGRTKVAVAVLGYYA